MGKLKNRGGGGNPPKKHRDADTKKKLWGPGGGKGGGGKKKILDTSYLEVLTLADWRKTRCYRRGRKRGARIRP